MRTHFASKSSRLVSSCLGLGSARFKVLAYHSISSSSRDPFEVRIDQFRQQMAYLADTGFTVVSLEAAWRDLCDGSIRPATVVITFDDGFRSLLDQALPVLDAYGFPATIFVPFAHVGGIDRFSYAYSRPDFEIMTLEEIADALQRGISFGAHGMTHADLTCLDDQALAYEIGESKRFLNTILGIDFSSFAYPFGMFDERVVQALNDWHYDCALCFGNVMGNSRYTAAYEMKREKVLATTKFDEFTELLDVRNDLARKVRHRFTMT